MSAHTPGPWNAEPISEGSGWVTIASEFRYCIGYATPLCNWTSAERDDDETLANARLIAAAPDFLAAAEIAAAELEAVEQNIGVASKALPLLRAALAKVVQP